MDITLYLSPVLPECLDFSLEDRSRPTIGDLLTIHLEGQPLPDIEKADIAILGVGEDRKSKGNQGCAGGPDTIRAMFYKLFPGQPSMKVVDLGNIRKGYTVQDTYFAVSTVVASLLKKNVFPFLLGGSQDLTFANYLAYERLGQIINMVSVDSSFDLGNAEDEDTSHSYLSRIIVHRPNILFNYANVGYQTYFVDQDAIHLMNNLMFDVYRLGKVRESLEEVEPIVRNADLLTFDMSAIRGADAPGNGNAGPNGFHGEEACQIMRYAGMSDKLSAAGIYEVNPGYDKRGLTALLAAQMLWYFIDGFYHRKDDLPSKNPGDYVKYTVTVDDHKEDLVFLKSKKSDRWWLEIPMTTADMRTQYERHYLVPCSYLDYQAACNKDIPDRWWKMYQKMM